MLIGPPVRPFGSILALGLALAPTATAAAPPSRPPIAPISTETVSGAHPLHRLVERERAPASFLGDALARGRLHILPRPPSADALSPALDCEHAIHDIQLHPQTGATTAELELRVRANGRPLTAIGFSLDEGLTVGDVTVDGGRIASVSDEVYPPSRVVRVDLSPALEPGETATLRIPYGGILRCGGYEGGGVVCAKGRDFSYFAHQSVFPYLFDPEDPYGYGLDGMTREIVLRVPADADVVATGEHVSDTVDGASRISRWSIGKPLSRALGMYVFAGKLGTRTVPGRAVPTTLVFPVPELPMDQRLATWSAPVLDFVEQLGGRPLPFQKSMTLVRLPGDVGDPGTATFGMTLLSETYARAGDLMHEETWAHENAHLFWGIVVPEKTSRESRILSEGLATLSEIDYTYASHFAGEDRDLYLARRFVPIGLDLRSGGKDLPAIQLAPGQPLPDDFRTALYTMWAYTKPAATLDHLRATIGDEVFARGLAAYVAQCSFVGCTPDDFRAVLEAASSRDLGPFFDRWVTGTSRPAVTVGFAQAGDGVDVELTKLDDLPMTLELWIELEDGRRIRRRAELGGRETRLHVTTPGAVRRVATSPRHDVMVDARSRVTGDLDFDGEVDGLDLLRCTRLVGKTYSGTSGLGLWNVGETFDPRCDVDGDMTIDDDDIAALAERFGTLRNP